MEWNFNRICSNGISTKIVGFAGHVCTLLDFSSAYLNTCTVFSYVLWISYPPNDIDIKTICQVVIEWYFSWEW